MLLKRSSLAFLIYLASVAASSPLETPGPADVKALEVRAVAPAVNSTAFEPPRIELSIVEHCAILTTGFTGVIASGYGLKDLINYIASKIKSQSDNHSCATISGSVDQVNYQFSASGRNCDTTAELKTIVDAVTKATNFMAKNNINDACFELTHGGTWKGLLQLAAGSGTIINNKCSSVSYPISI